MFGVFDKGLKKVGWVLVSDRVGCVGVCLEEVGCALVCLNVKFLPSRRNRCLLFPKY